MRRLTVGCLVALGWGVLVIMVAAIAGGAFNGTSYSCPASPPCNAPPGAAFNWRDAFIAGGVVTAFVLAALAVLLLTSRKNSAQEPPEVASDESAGKTAPDTDHVDR